MKKVILIGLSATIVLTTMLFTACKKSTPVPANAKNEIAYIYRTNNNDALAFKALMEANNTNVQVIELADAASHNYSKYKLIVADHNTNVIGEGFWTDAHATTLKASGKPMLLLGMGGLLYAKKIGNVAQWNISGQFDEKDILVKDQTSNLYKLPKAIAISAGQTVSLYPVPSPGAGAYTATGALAGVTLMASFSSQHLYNPIAHEQNRYTIFGFFKGVNSMTAAGKDFMVNLVYFSGSFSL